MALSWSLFLGPQNQSFFMLLDFTTALTWVRCDCRRPVRHQIRCTRQSKCSLLCQSKCSLLCQSKCSLLCQSKCLLLCQSKCSLCAKASAQVPVPK